MNDTIEFYDLKTRAKVQVLKTDVTKSVTTRQTKKGETTRYVLKALVNGVNVSKFVTKEVYDSLIEAKQG